MSSMRFDFTGRTVVVTGGARGIGLGLAEGFVAAGASVFILDAEARRLADVARRIGAMGVVVDVSESAAVDAAVRRVVAESGRVDVLVNNAGILRDKMLWKMEDDDWDSVLTTHAGGSFRMTRACIPHFRARHFGRVVNVTSYSGLRGNVGQANYATAKAGIIGFTKTAAKELAGFGVTVNAISPNAETRMVASVPSQKMAELTAAIPMNRFADPAEIFPAVAFLASEEAGYITGSVLPVDGGLSI